jgi:hypothetical protein
LVWHEGFTLVTPTEGEYKLVQLDHYSPINKSVLMCWRSTSSKPFIDDNYPENVSRIETPLIPFVSIIETKERINKLLLFS